MDCSVFIELIFIEIQYLCLQRLQRFKLVFKPISVNDVGHVGGKNILSTIFKTEEKT